MSHPLIYLVAGEPSGDVLGATLMRVLRKRAEGRVRFAGVGGERMAAEGLNSLFPIADLAVMGLLEVVPSIPRILGRLRETVADIRSVAPDLVLTIDAPGFNFRLGRRLRSATDRPIIHYVAPTVWAWKPGRARKIARFLDHLLVMLPFEPPYFEREGLPATFVGHPVVEAGWEQGDGRRFRERYAVAPQARVVAVLPGSRKSEVDRHLPIFRQAMARFDAEATVMVPTVANVEQRVADHLREWPNRTVLIDKPEEKADAFAACQIALAASGTVALELAMASVPSIIAYRPSLLTEAIVRLMLRVDFVSLVNILEDAPVVPEYLGVACRSDRLAAALDALASADGQGQRLRQAAAAHRVRAALTPKGGSPGLAAADAVLGLLQAAGRTRRSDPLSDLLPDNADGERNEHKNSGQVPQ